MTLVWPKSRAYVEPRYAQDRAEQLYKAHKSMWHRHHTSYMRFLEEHAPGIWEKVSHCREGRPLVTPIQGGDPICLVQLEGCKQYPWCPSCNHEAMLKRAHKALKLFQKATPRKDDPRVWVIEMGPGGFHGRDWAAWAMESFRGYMAAQYRVLEWAFCENVGAVATFQPFGERLWAQPHPHVHWVVNGWMPTEDKPKRVKRYELAGDGRDALLRKLKEEIERESGCKAPLDTLWVDIRAPEQGAKRALAYNMRELIDPTKWTYRKKDGMLDTESYQTGEVCASFEARTIPPRVSAYGATYAHWGVPGPRPVDKRYGCFSNRSFNETAIAIGGDIDHQYDCLCTQCKTWGRPARGNDLGHEGLNPRASPAWS